MANRQNRLTAARDVNARAQRMLAQVRQFAERGWKISVIGGVICWAIGADVAEIAL